MNKKTDKIAKALDEWAKGYACGVLTGVVLTIGVMWAVVERIR